MAPMRALARTYALPMLVGLLAISIRLSVGALTIDDAFITFRYSRNVAYGLGLVYNPGQHVLGTTTPLWTLILAVVYRFGAHDLSSVALVLSSLADAATASLLFLTARRVGWGIGWATWLAVLFAFCPLSIDFAASGMESSLFTLLALGALTSFDRPQLAAMLCGLAILCRPEGLIVAALVLGWQAIQNRRLPLGKFAITTAVVIPWLIFSAIYYGSPIPESALIKASHYAPDAIGNLRWLVTNLGAPGFDEPLIEGSQLIGSVAWKVGLGFGAALLLALPRLARYLRRSPEMVPLVAFAPILALTLVAEGLRSAHIFPWYLVPFVPFVLLGIVGVLHNVTAHLPKVGIVAMAVFSLWSLLGLNLGRQSNLATLAPFRVNLAREQAYTQAGQFLNSRLPVGAIIAAPEIGALGYATSDYILDTAGLVSPEAARFYPLPPDYPRDITVPPRLIEQEQPDAIVVFAPFYPHQLRDAPWFAQEYVQAATFRADIWGFQAVYVFTHR